MFVIAALPTAFLLLGLAAATTNHLQNKIDEVAPVSFIKESY